MTLLVCYWLVIQQRALTNNVCTNQVLLPCLLYNNTSLSRGHVWGNLKSIFSAGVFNRKEPYFPRAWKKVHLALEVRVSRTFVLTGQRATMGTTTVRLHMVVGTATAAHLKDHLTSSQLHEATPPTYSHTAMLTVVAMTTAHHLLLKQ